MYLYNSVFQDLSIKLCLPLTAKTNWMCNCENVPAMFVDLVATKISG